MATLHICGDKIRGQDISQQLEEAELEVEDRNKDK